MASITAEDPVAEVVRAHAASLLRIARAHSLCDDDAADAYQRTLEIYLQRVDRVDRATVGQWLRTVCKHEAMRLRASRQRVAPADPRAWDSEPAADPHDGAERAASLERVARAAEALRACSPVGARALLLRADGASYAEIGEACGWTHSQVNRALSDARRRFLERFSHIESGAACAGHLPRLMAIADGEATPDDYMRLRPHLRHCASCRRVLKALYESEPAVAGLLPAAGLSAVALAGGPVLEPVGIAPGWLARALDSLGLHLADRVARGHALLEAGAGKAAAVVASTAAVAVGGAAVVDHQQVDRPPAARAAAIRVDPPRPKRMVTPAATPAETGAASAPAVTVTAAPSPEHAPAAERTPASPATAAATAASAPPPAPAAVAFAIERPSGPAQARTGGAAAGSFEASSVPDGAASGRGGGELTFER